ncbi:MAG: DUF5610 domain-containing protein [Gammaproteobacteria bacterium]|nr:DUF5610 domain-containing protein [Gammaproteobacteria bacterium]
MNTLFNNQGYAPGNSMGNVFNSAAFNSQALKQADFNKAYNSGFKPEQSPAQLLENQISKKIPELSSVSQQNTGDFSPQAVADRVIGYVETAIRQRAGSELEAQSMLQQAKEGISQGFAEARNILSDMPQMTESIKTQIAETETLIFQGLDNIANNFNDKPLQQQRFGELISESAALTSRFEQSKEASIEIVTQDGDKIEVSYSAFIESASSQSYSRNQQGSSASYELSSVSSSAFQFSVQGELDEGEQQAINELLNKVGDLASQFFNGDVQAAFNSAMQLGFDSEELKSFALDFQQSTYIEVTQTYQRTEQFNDSATRPPAPGPAAAIDLLSQLEKLIEQQNNNHFLEQPENTVKTLLTDMMDLVNQDYSLPAHNFINEIIESV